MNQSTLLFGFLLAILPLIWQAWQYLDQRRQAVADNRFSTYHDLIKRLVEPESGGGAVRIDRQIAVVFELRNFPEYSEVSLRILKGLRASWTEAAWKRVIDEIDLTIAYLERR